MLFLARQAVQPTGRCNLQWLPATRATVQISVLKQKRPQQMWHCKTTSVHSSGDAVITPKTRASSKLLLTAEKTSPAGLRTVLHHRGSWNNDVTFEPQLGPDQMGDFFWLNIYQLRAITAHLSGCLMVTLKPVVRSSTKTIYLFKRMYWVRNPSALCSGWH